MLRAILTGALTGLLMYSYLYYSQAGDLTPGLGFFIGLAFAGGIGLLIGMLIRGSSQLLNKWLPWPRNIAFRLLAGSSAQPILAGAIIAGAGWLFEIWSMQPILPESESSPAIKLGILLFFAGFIYNIIDFTLFSYNQFAVTQIETARTERKQLELQYDALRSQLSPHYLFNSLNTVSALVYQDAQLAEEFIRKLVQTYQYILDTNQKKLVTMAEELNFLKAYQFLLKVRFTKGLELKVSIPDENLQSMMPPLTLQLLVENAVKHNVVSAADPLRILVSIEKGQVLVQNNRTSAPVNQSPSLRVGISNIRKRYHFFTSEPIEVTDQDGFMVKLPLLAK